MKYLVFLLSFIYTGAIINAQTTVTFQYLNVETEQGFADEAVQLKDNKTGQLYEGTTDANGEVTFKLPIGTSFDILLAKETPDTKISTEGMSSNMWRTFSYYGMGTAYFASVEEEKARQEAENAKLQEEARLLELEWEAARIAWEEEKAQKEAEKVAQQQRQAEWEESITKENNQSEETGSVYFYLINEGGSYVGGLKTYDGENEKNGCIGESHYYWRGKACTGSVVNSEEPIAITRAPGTYNFYATTGNGQKEWSGTYTIEAGKVNTIGLDINE